MTCEEARELIGADPDGASTELLAHLKDCPECQAYRSQMIAFNARIRRALELSPHALARESRKQDFTQPQSSAVPPTDEPVAMSRTSDDSSVVRLTREPETSAKLVREPTARRRGPTSRRGWAMAASLAAAAIVGAMMWLSRPTESLASEIVTHVEHEPDSWGRTQSVTAAELEAVLRKGRVKMGPGVGKVVYANGCWFRGHFVPHLVISTQDGPVTVIILKAEHVTATRAFNEAGYSGLLLPAHSGSIAILSRTPMELEKPAQDVLRALEAAAP